MPNPILENFESKSAARQKEYRKFLNDADWKKELKRLPELHDEAFREVDCLECSRCCKNYSPRFKAPDIRRIAKALKMKEGAFTDKYLKQDEDGDYVVQSHPCPFLGADNFCSIYEDRPSDCRRFPYTDEDVFFKKKNITLKNSTFCPAVYYVLEKFITT